MLETKQKATVVTEDDKDTYLRFGGAALASMLHLRYEKMKGVKFDDKNVKQISEEITILQRINSYTKEHIPDYLKYRDNGHMYFPCPAILQFLTAVDLTTKENANEAGFKEHGSDLLHKVSTDLQAATHLRALFINLLATKVPEFGDLSQNSISNVYNEETKQYTS